MPNISSSYDATTVVKTETSTFSEPRGLYWHQIDAGVGSNVTNADGSVDQIITVTAAAAGTVTLTSATYSGLVAGDVIRIAVPIKIENPVGLTILRVVPAVTVGGVAAYFDFSTLGVI